MLARACNVECKFEEREKEKKKKRKEKKIEKKGTSVFHRVRITNHRQGLARSIRSRLTRASPVKGDFIIIPDLAESHRPEIIASGGD